MYKISLIPAKMRFSGFSTTFMSGANKKRFIFHKDTHLKAKSKLETKTLGRIMKLNAT